ncbi:MAG: ASKHA domain-containing protein [Clostridiales bacterium]|nr:ASKHA domain-containing protein [Clostridiales bacterium]
MKVTFLPDHIVREVETGTTIMQAAIDAGLKIDAPCGGNGKCKKCKVKVTNSKGSEVVLACTTEVTEDITVELGAKDEGHRILMGGISRDIVENPAVKAVTVKVPEPSTEDLRACWLRLKDTVAEAAGIPAEGIRPSVYTASHLYNTLTANNFEVDALIYDNTILDVVPVGSDVLAMAFDIGTTTIAAYFIDLRSGEQLAQASVLNPQTKYGADVIMRMKYSIENGLEGPTGDVREALMNLTEQCCKETGKELNSIYVVTLVGNTCMHHLFMGINPSSLAYAPYTAAIAEPIIENAKDYGFRINPSAKLFFLPNIAGFVGADTVGAALAAAMDEAEEMTLLIDIGTNGEMVMGNKNRLVACSTAAGPAFEGALITYGMRGAAGAIDHFKLSGGKLDYSVIGDGKPIGICGSGLIDLLSELVRVGLVESGGKFLMGDEIKDEEGKLYANRIEMRDGFRCFVIADETESGNGERIVFTQKDVREVQLAKGAMAAGIQMMCQRLGITTKDIVHIMIAGAFGSYMSPKSAAGIALIPPELGDEVVAIGNAAGQGAKLCALSVDEYKRSARLAVKMEYLELAADPKFQDIFVDELEFPSKY